MKIALKQMAPYSMIRHGGFFSQQKKNNVITPVHKKHRDSFHLCKSKWRNNPSVPQTEMVSICTKERCHLSVPRRGTVSTYAKNVAAQPKTFFFCNLFIKKGRKIRQQQKQDYNIAASNKRKTCLKHRKKM